MARSRMGKGWNINFDIIMGEQAGVVLCGRVQASKSGPVQDSGRESL